MLSGNEHEEVGDEGRDERMENAIPKGIVNQEQPGDDGIQVTPCAHESDFILLAWPLKWTKYAKRKISWIIGLSRAPLRPA